MICLIILSVLAMAAYTAAVCLKSEGMPYSISATFYILDHRAWFTLTMWAAAGLLMPAMLEISGTNTEFLAFLACAGMLLVGAAPNFREDLEGKAHKAGAVLCIGGSQLWVAFHFPWALLVWFVWTVGTLLRMSRDVTFDIRDDFRRTKPLFRAEVAALLSTYASAFILC